MMAWPRIAFGPSTPSSESQAIGVLPWRRQHLVELDDGLRGVDLPRSPALVGGALEASEQIGRARVDLGRREEAAHEVAVGAVVLLVELDGPGEAAAPCLLVPFPLDPPAVAREPAAGAEGEAHVDAQAEVARPRATTYSPAPPISITVVTPPRSSSAIEKSTQARVASSSWAAPRTGRSSKRPE